MTNMAHRKEHMKTIKQKLKKSTIIISSVASEYCSSSTIHGLKYLGMKDLHLIEKIWWLLVILLSLSASVYLIFQIWIKWMESPVVVTYSPVETSIWDIPFPAITICPLNRIKQSAFNFSELLSRQNKLEGKEKEQFWDVAQLCNRFHYANHTSDEQIFDNVMKAAPQLFDTIKRVRWQNKEWTEIDKLFTPRLTAEGLCFSFNSLGTKEIYTSLNTNIKDLGTNRKAKGWDAENGYKQNTATETYPERIWQTGVSEGLQLWLESDSRDREFECGLTVAGFKIILHHPMDIPRVNQHYTLVSVNTYSMLAVKPHVVTTSSGLKNILLTARHCRFPQNIRLVYYSLYTQNNCLLECFRNTSVRMCTCLPFYFPGNNDTQICGIMHRECIIQGENSNAFFATKMDMTEICKCLPSCASLEYSAVISYTDIHHDELMTDSRNGSDEPLSDTIEKTRVNIFFNERKFTVLHRSELYKQLDFIAQCGGLLGLCMGFSFLSFMEIVYFITIRLYYKWKDQKMQKC